MVKTQTESHVRRPVLSLNKPMADLRFFSFEVRSEPQMKKTSDGSLGTAGICQVRPLGIL